MKFTVEWKAGVATEHVRVLTTGERAEAARVAQVLHATLEVFQSVLGTTTDLGREFTFYLVTNEEAKKAFLDNIPLASAAQRLLFDQLEGTGLKDSSSGASWAPSPERRLDGAVRHTLGAMLQVEFGLTPDSAWAWEGLGLYLTRELIGTRYTWYVNPASKDQPADTTRGSGEFLKKLLTPGTNWMNEGYHLLRESDAQSLATTLERPLNKLVPQDVFLSYVVSAYLLESQAQKLPDILRMLGSRTAPGQKASKVWPAVLGMDMEIFFPRLIRWLGERR
jgi:hypothetical protein